MQTEPDILLHFGHKTHTWCRSGARNRLASTQPAEDRGQNQDRRDVHGATLFAIM